MFIPDPGSWFLPISDPGSKKSIERERWTNFLVLLIIVATNFTKLNMILFLMLKKKIWPIFRIIELFTQKFVTKLSKIWVWDPRSGIRKKTYSGSRIQGQKGTGSRIPDAQHWCLQEEERGFCLLLPEHWTAATTVCLGSFFRSSRLRFNSWGNRDDLESGAVDPDPDLYGSGSFHQQAKQVRKTLFSTIFWSFFWLLIFEDWCKCTFKKK